MFVDQQKIQIEGAGAVGRVKGAVTPIAAFEGQEKVEEGPGLEIGIELRDGVHKGGLGFKAEGLGAVQVGMGSDLSGGSEAVDRLAERLLRGAGRRGEVGSEAYICAMLHIVTVPDFVGWGVMLRSDEDRVLWGQL